jgi:hypothetical protein
MIFMILFFTTLVVVSGVILAKEALNYLQLCKEDKRFLRIVKIENCGQTSYEIEHWINRSWRKVNTEQLTSFEAAEQSLSSWDNQLRPKNPKKQVVRKVDL